MSNPKFIRLLHSQVEYFAKTVSNSQGNILYLHGFGGSFLSHQSIEKRLVNYNYYAINYPGHGKTIPHTSDDFDMHYYSDLVVAFISKMQLTNIIVIGHSLGGAITVLSYMKKPSAFNKVILVGPINKTILTMQSNLYDLFFPADFNDWLKIAPQFYYHFQKYLNDSVYVSNIKKWITLINSHNLYACGFLTLGPSCLIEENLDLIEIGIQNITCPFYLLYGEYDLIINNKAIACYYQKHNSHCHVIKIPGCDHTPWYDDEITYWRILKKILIT